MKWVWCSGQNISNDQLLSLVQKYTMRVKQLFLISVFLVYFKTSFAGLGKQKMILFPRSIFPVRNKITFFTSPIQESSFLDSPHPT